MENREPVTFYYPGMSRTEEDGSIVMRATGYDDKGHWTGQHSVRTDSADFEFWQWVVRQRDRWSDVHFFSSKELPKIRAEYDSTRRPDAGNH